MHCFHFIDKVLSSTSPAMSWTTSAAYFMLLSYRKSFFIEIDVILYDRFGKKSLVIHIHIKVFLKQSDKRKGRRRQRFIWALVKKEFKKIPNIGERGWMIGSLSNCQVDIVYTEQELTAMLVFVKILVYLQLGLRSKQQKQSRRKIEFKKTQWFKFPYSFSTN